MNRSGFNIPSAKSLAGCLAACLLGWLGCGGLPAGYVPPADFPQLAQDAQIGIIATPVEGPDGVVVTVLTTADGQYIGTFPYHLGDFGHCNYSPDGTWGSCCAVHDILYTQGGSEADRYFADAFLQDCINNHGGPGPIYFDAVRTFGWLAFNYTQ